MKELDNVNASLAAFQPRYKGLILAKLLSKLRLSKTGSFPFANNRLDQGRLLRRSKCFSELRASAFHGALQII